MYYVDLQKTVTRRESSLIASKKYLSTEDRTDYDFMSTARGQSTARLTSDSASSVVGTRPKGSVENELVTMLFESMLDSIVESWEVIVQQKPEGSTPNMEFGKTVSELTIMSKKKKSIAKSSKTKRSRSKLDMNETGQPDSLHQVWWSSPDERAIIKFRNGNIYEGNISMKCMHGEGRFQWADGTIYLGQFKDNEMHGKGLIQWKDDTWYEGDFLANLRHGRGLYVDSRNQRSYAGGWHCGTKHGEGVIFYSESFKNSYDGQWVNFYRGEWKNGVMSGYGIYIWDAYYNNTMSSPSINAYRGLWSKGQRNGYGVLNLGLGLGSHYKGDFRNNKKHGAGKFVTNNGLILQDKNLFHDDNLGTLLSDDNENGSGMQDVKRCHIQEPFTFDICDDTVGLLYHIEYALKNLDKEAEVRANIINNYFENNKAFRTTGLTNMRKEEHLEDTPLHFEDLILFEESSLRKSLRCYEIDLKNIYYKYATICNIEEIHFTPVLIRLHLWQLYYDCNIHEKGLTLVEIDRIFQQNPEWLARTPHNPFETIYFWQFLHSLISVASRLYAKKHLPKKRPDTILASAFRYFMEHDVLPCVGRRKGRLVNGYGSFVPLKGCYELYRSLGEPHTIRIFLCAVRQPPHNIEQPQGQLVEASDDNLPLGKNVYIFGNEITFVTDENTSKVSEDDYGDRNIRLKLFNLGNLSSKTIINIFKKIFPQLCNDDKIMNLKIEISFFEFFEAFVACVEESIQVKDEELRWREKFTADEIASSFGTKIK
ncbi:radial spoke head 10 homolog B isoform X2 [Manduca sexta]|uniref:radial spoke head 10 homolog B isoform X2 n=1 Tax=Manduca sexta TaxID=7130 RepID=UPI00188F305A|nr:radial spoke head 10 homolog B isoform X2 [Manduca sexta]